MQNTHNKCEQIVNKYTSVFIYASKFVSTVEKEKSHCQAVGTHYVQNQLILLPATKHSQ